MAITNARMQMRRGLEADFDPDKMQPGEWAVSLDSKYVRMCVSPGICVRMATYDAFETDMEEIRQILLECQTIEEGVNEVYEKLQGVVVDVERVEAAAQTATDKAEAAGLSAETAANNAAIATESANKAKGNAEEAEKSENNANQYAQTTMDKANEAFTSANTASIKADESSDSAILSKSYAVGGTDTRDGENTDNSQYYNEQAKAAAERAETAAEKAESISNIGIATESNPGIVKPDGTTTTVSEDGTISVIGGGGGTGTTDYEKLENKPSIEGITLYGNKTLDELGIQKKGEYLTNESDPTVPAWAKASTKPTYTADEVGADIAGSASAALSGAKTYTDEKINKLINGAPSTLDTLSEIATALEENNETVEAIDQAIGNKLAKNGDSKDNTTTFTKATARVNIASTEKHSTIFGKIAKWFSDLKTVAFTGSYNDLINKPNIPKKTSELENDSGFIESAVNLDSYEEIMANTDPGKYAGGLGVKEGFTSLNSRLKADNGQQFQFAYDSESQKYGYMAEVEGADTFFPFSDGFDFDFNNAQIPVMTSATSPSGIVTSSGASGSAYQDWCAFNPTHSWWNVPGKSSWIQYQSVLDMKFSWLFIDFNTPEVIERTVKLEISLDGSSWETILDETLANNYMYLIHKFDKQYSAKYIKLTQSYPVKGYPGLRYMSLIK